MLTFPALIFATIAISNLDSLYDHDMKLYDSLFQQDTSTIADNPQIKKNTLYKHDISPVHLGIIIGLGWSDFYGKDAAQMDCDARSNGLNPGSRFGMLIGGSYSYDINKLLTVGIDADYAMKGKKITGSTAYGLQQTQILKFNYLELPVILKVNIPTDAAFKPNVYFGPLVSLLLSAENYLKLEYNGSSRDTSVFLTDVNSTEYGVVFGIGGYETTAEGDISLEGRCSLGLSTTDNSKPVSAIIKNWQIAIILGFLFPI